MSVARRVESVTTAHGIWVREDSLIWFYVLGVKFETTADVGYEFAILRRT